MKKFVYYYEKTIEYMMATTLAIMFLAVFTNVMLRYLFGSGIAASVELSRLLFVWLIFLGATLAVGRNAHIGFDLVQRHLPQKIRKLCAIISHCLMLYALFLLFQGSLNQCKVGWHVTSTVMKYPLALMSSTGIFASLCMGFYIAINLLRIITGNTKSYLPGTLPPLPAQHKENN